MHISDQAVKYQMYTAESTFDKLYVLMMKPNIFNKLNKFLYSIMLTKESKLCLRFHCNARKLTYHLPHFRAQKACGICNYKFLQTVSTILLLITSIFANDLGNPGIVFSILSPCPTVSTKQQHQINFTICVNENVSIFTLLVYSYNNDVVY